MQLLQRLPNLPAGLKDKELSAALTLYREHVVDQVARLAFIGTKAQLLEPHLRKKLTIKSDSF